MVSPSYEFEVYCEKAAILIRFDDFGTYREEIDEVFSAARQGKHVDINVLHGKLVRREVFFSLIAVGLAAVLIAVIVPMSTYIKQREISAHGQHKPVSSDR